MRGSDTESLGGGLCWAAAPWGKIPNKAIVQIARSARHRQQGGLRVVRL